jgi:uncharacterized protein YjbI with pentapeptide repeats
MALLASELFEGAALRNTLLLGVDLNGVSAKNLLFESSKISRGSFLSAELDSAQLVSVVVEDCEMSGLLTPFSTFQRVEFKSCRMTGWQAGEGLVEDTLFDGCKMDLVSFRFGKLKSVIFRSCLLRAADFHGCSFTDVSFEKCDLAGAEFRQCSVASLDLRTSEIAKIRYVEGLKGATIEPSQLMDLAPLLARSAGLKVTD